MRTAPRQTQRTAQMSNIGLAIFIACTEGALLVVIFILKKMYANISEEYAKAKRALDSSEEQIEHDKEVIQKLKDEIYSSATSSVDSRLNFMRDAD